MRVLAISAHPDDETLGCGGTLLKHRERGDDVHWLIATRATGPRWSDEVRAQKAREIEAVAAAYAVTSVVNLGLPSSRLDAIPLVEMVEGLRGAIEDARPEVVYVVFGGDVHTDHQRLFAATASAIKPLLMTRFGIRRLLCFETLSSTEAAAPSLAQPFLATAFSDITKFIDRKIEIMGLYESEMQSDPEPRTVSAIRALARFRGGTIGVPYGEAFSLVRELF